MTKVGLTLDDVYNEATASPNLRKYGSKKWFRAVHKAVEATYRSNSPEYGRTVTAVGSTFTVRYYPGLGTFTVSDGDL